MTLHPLLALAAAALAGCAATPGAVPSRGDSATCVALFQWFDTIEATMSTPSGQNDRRVIPMELELPAQRLRSAGCITMSDDLAGMSTAGGIAASPGGPATAPILLHAGAITNMEDDAAARLFFAANGVPARSIGSPALGRRIYLGPFDTEGDLKVARDLAVRGGFAFPYPTRRML